MVFPDDLHIFVICRSRRICSWYDQQIVIINSQQMQINHEGKTENTNYKFLEQLNAYFCQQGSYIGFLMVSKNYSYSSNRIFLTTNSTGIEILMHSVVSKKDTFKNQWFNI